MLAQPSLAVLEPPRVPVSKFRKKKKILFDFFEERYLFYLLFSFNITFVIEKITETFRILFPTGRAKSFRAFEAQPFLSSWETCQSFDEIKAEQK